MINKNIVSVDGAAFGLTESASSPRRLRGPRHWSQISLRRPLSALGLAGLLATAGCSLRQAYPETQIRGYINGQPFSVQAPKDSSLTGFDAMAETNGTIHVHIDSLQSSLNPTNLANAANGQAAIVTATGQVINQAIQTATTTALKAATVP
ncbi:MAG: hypothetical protein JWQ04_484 [Pedosphaera sp.]|nr:hypothetical protein [Pedosphaera sp.]